MNAILDRILAFNLIDTTVIFIIVARLYVLPRLDEWPARGILLPILLLHSLRHLGLMFLSRGAVYPGMASGSPIPPSPWPRCTGRPSPWAPRTGFPRSGYRRSW
jgi:hypothetical protein